MLRTTKSMREKYEKIQNFIFSLIPEKWEEIYLYASVVTNSENKQTGELFFYYLPKGILKKRAINVYEVPKRFNINEEQYLKIVEDLYKCITELKQDFIDTEQDIWTNLTISIANCKFKVEYNYDILLPMSEDEINQRNIIWKYKYLNLGGETKEERKILDEYFSVSKPTKKETYETGLYMKTDSNSISFDKEDSFHREFILYEKDDILNKADGFKSKILKKHLNNRNKNLYMLEEKNKEVENENKENKEIKKEQKKSKNQILDG